MISSYDKWTSYLCTCTDQTLNIQTASSKDQSLFPYHIYTLRDQSDSLAWSMVILDLSELAVSEWYILLNPLQSTIVIYGPIVMRVVSNLVGCFQYLKQWLFTLNVARDSRTPPNSRELLSTVPWYAGGWVTPYISRAYSPESRTTRELPDC